MHWTVAAPWIDKVNMKEESWLVPYTNNSSHQFEIIPRSEPLPNWHDRKSAVTGLRDWSIYWQQGSDAIKATKGGVITVFPQLPAVVGMQKRITGKRFPIVAWLFNVGTCSDGIRRLLAQVSLQDIDRFIVHTRREQKIYPEWLEIPKERFEFVPYHVGEKNLPSSVQENNTDPFITALGSAHRDFPTLFEAVEKLNISTIIAAGKRVLEGLTIPSQIKPQFGISKADCLRLTQSARINVIPLLPNPKVTAAGQITIIEAMTMGCAVIATRCNGAEDYIQHGETGLLVEPQSVDDLVKAINMLWNDPGLRRRLGQAAQRYAQEHFSPEAAGASLTKILDKVADEVS
ncbi:MAG: glycosyltransferase family 4 protein [Waterburya sp.]